MAVCDFSRNRFRFPRAALLTFLNVLSSFQQAMTLLRAIAYFQESSFAYDASIKGTPSFVLVLSLPVDLPCLHKKRKKKVEKTRYFNTICPLGVHKVVQRIVKLFYSLCCRSSLERAFVLLLQFTGTPTHSVQFLGCRWSLKLDARAFYSTYNLFASFAKGLARRTRYPSGALVAASLQVVTGQDWF